MNAVDLILCGSVAVRRDGARIGKGGGYSDLEYAIALELGIITSATPIITTVHPLQIVTGRIALAPHDIPVDFIVTPEKSIATKTRISRPRGIYWDYLDEDHGDPPAERNAEKDAGWPPGLGLAIIRDVRQTLVCRPPTSVCRFPHLFFQGHDKLKFVGLLKGGFNDAICR